MTATLVCLVAVLVMFLLLVWACLLVPDPPMPSQSDIDRGVCEYLREKEGWSEEKIRECVEDAGGAYFGPNAPDQRP